MALTNQERVGKALDLLKDGLAPFVERELKAQDAQGWLGLVRQSGAAGCVKIQRLLEIWKAGKLAA